MTPTTSPWWTWRALPSGPSASPSRREAACKHPAPFKADPVNRGKGMRSGGWAYTRHPNYFGDATQWWGLYVIAAGASDGYWTLLGPLLVTAPLFPGSRR